MRHSLVAIFLVTAVMGTSPAGQNISGPCVNRLVSSGDEVRDTPQFIYYLRSLLNQKIVTSNDLALFLAALEKNTLTNPVPNRAELKFTFHHREFQSLIDTWKVERGEILKWGRTYMSSVLVTENQKKISKEHSILVPTFIAPDGAMFYKIKHPQLGDAYKILKSGGHFEVDHDWEETIWAVNALNDKQANIGKTSAAKKACTDLGPSADLPTLDHYHQILKHFDHKLDETSNAALTRVGLQDYWKIFPDSKDKWFWSSSKNFTDQMFGWVFDAEEGEMFKNATRNNRYWVRCIAAGREAW